MSVEITSTKGIVKALLESHAHLRDSDEKLIANVWWNDLKRRGLDYKKMSAEDFMKHFAAGNLTNPESVRRSRQQLQELNVNLRGKFYKNKQSKQVEVKKELGYYEHL